MENRIVRMVDSVPLRRALRKSAGAFAAIVGTEPVAAGRRWLEAGGCTHLRSWLDNAIPVVVKAGVLRTTCLPAFSGIPAYVVLFWHSVPPQCL
jgi:hypothetical protein